MNKKRLVLKLIAFILGIFLFACQGDEYSLNNQSITRSGKKRALTDTQIETLKKNEEKVNKMLSFENGRFAFKAKSGSEIGLDEHLFQYCLKRVAERNQLIVNLEKEGYVTVVIKKNCVALTKSKNKIQPMRSIIINKEYSVEVPFYGTDGICLTDLNITDVYLSESTMRNIIDNVKYGYSNPIPSWIPYSIASDIKDEMEWAKLGSGIISWFEGYYPCMHICEEHMYCTYESKKRGDIIWLTY